MFEKKIKKFFNSVSVCGEPPKHEIKIDKRLLAITFVSAGALCAAFGAGLTIHFLNKKEK